MIEKAPPIGTVLTGEAAERTLITPASGIISTELERRTTGKGTVEVPIGITADGDRIDLTFNLIEHANGVKGWDAKKERRNYKEASTILKKPGGTSPTPERITLRKAIWKRKWDPPTEVTIGGEGNPLVEGDSERKTYKTMEWGEIPQDEVEFPRRELTEEEKAELHKQKCEQLRQLFTKVDTLDLDLKDALQTVFRIRAKKSWPRDDEGNEISPGAGINGLDNALATLNYVKAKIAIAKARERNAREGEDPLTHLIQSLTDDQIDNEAERLQTEEEVQSHLLKLVKKEIVRQKRHNFNMRLDEDGNETGESAEDREFPIGMRVNAPTPAIKKGRLSRFGPKRSDLGRDSWRIARKGVRPKKAPAIYLSNSPDREVRPSLFDPEGLHRFGPLGKDRGADPDKAKTVMLVNMQGDTQWVSLEDLRSWNSSPQDRRPSLIWRDGLTQGDTLARGGAGGDGEDGGGEDVEDDPGSTRWGRRRKTAALIAAGLIGGTLLGLEINDTIQDSHIQKNQAKIATYDRWAHQDEAHRLAVASKHEKADHVRQDEILKKQNQIEQGQTADAAEDQAIRDHQTQIEATQQKILQNQAQEGHGESQKGQQQRSSGTSPSPNHKAAKGPNSSGGQEGQGGGKKGGSGEIAADDGREVLVEPNDGFTQVIERNFPGYSPVAYDRAHLAAFKRFTTYIKGIPTYKRSGAVADIGFSHPGLAHWDNQARDYIRRYLEDHYGKL